MVFDQVAEPSDGPSVEILCATQNDTTNLATGEIQFGENMKIFTLEEHYREKHALEMGEHYSQQLFSLGWVERRAPIG